MSAYCWCLFCRIMRCRIWMDMATILIEGCWPSFVTMWSMTKGTQDEEEQAVVTAVLLTAIRTMATFPWYHSSTYTICCAAASTKIHPSSLFISLFTATRTLLRIFCHARMSSYWYHTSFPPPLPPPINIYQPFCNNTQRVCIFTYHHSICDMYTYVLS